MEGGCIPSLHLFRCKPFFGERHIDKTRGTGSGIQGSGYRCGSYGTLNSASGSKFYTIKNASFPYSRVMNQENVPNISRVDVSDSQFKVTTYRTSDMSVVDTYAINKKHECTVCGKVETAAIPVIQKTTTESLTGEMEDTESTESSEDAKDTGTTEDKTGKDSKLVKTGDTAPIIYVAVIGICACFVGAG